MKLRGGSSLKDPHADFRHLYDAALPVVYGFVYFRVAGNRALAEDLTAEVFASAAQEYRSGRLDVVTVSWLRTVAKRRLIDHWRHQEIVRNSRARTFERLLPDGEPDTGERQLVLQSLAALSPDARTALTLQHLDGYTIREISEVIDRSEKATESLLTRARSAFRASYLEAQHG